MESALCHRLACGTVRGWAADPSAARYAGLVRQPIGWHGASCLQRYGIHDPALRKLLAHATESRTDDGGLANSMARGKKSAIISALSTQRSLHVKTNGLY